ncbi:MAG: adenylate/guanylate cyclase domain-containing protein [Alphaproteobacteria bacterium]|nr:adenylate/guanylate cyclase domain-containing protein [Alphaproteobacteria bacterium]
MANATNPDKVGDWLGGLGLEQYAAAFRDNAIDVEVLPDLTADDLKDLGVGLVGHRRKLLAAIAALRDVATLPDGAPAAREAPGPAPPTDMAERRQLTILFCDLVGSTELALRLDLEDLREVIAGYHRRVSELLTRHGGFIAKFMGDGVLAYFGYPGAHEDDAERSVRAGLAIAEAIGHLASPAPLRVRIGIATGLVVVGDLLGSGASREQAVVGETPNLAARLQALAEPNAVIVADSTRRQLGALFETQDLGPRTLKGFSEAQRAWRVIGESGVESRFAAFRTSETPLVGRAEELDLLLRRWSQAKGREGRVVLLAAEPGIGKSRLTEALVERIAGEAPVVLRYFCSPHHEDSALYPVIAQLERAAGFTRADPPAAKHAKLRALLAGSASVADDLPLLAELLSLPGGPSMSALEMPPQRKKELSFEALLRQLEALAHRQPVLMLFEDLHWIDPTTRELLDRTIQRVEGLPVLLIATFRPEFQSPWTGQPHVTMLALSRLGRRDGATLVRQLLADAAALPAETVAEIVERTDGVPLFLEEVTKVVLEAALSSTAGGTVAALPGTRLAVPPTLQASLMARLDRLGAAARDAAQTGAAIGRNFSHELLLAASRQSEAETGAALDGLVSAGLVFQRGVPPQAEYQFKHALIQDTAYGTLLRGPRQALHARIARAMRERSPDIVERSPEFLAHHLTEAGEFERAATFWLAAGRRAADRSANIEVAAHLARGIAALSGLPETPERDGQELALQLAIGPALLSNRGFAAPEARGAYQRARDVAERLDDDRARFAATWGLWLTALGSERGNENRLRYLGELVELADRIGDPELTLQAHHSAWATWMYGGDFIRGQDHIRQGLALYDPDKHRHHALMYGGHDPGVCCKGGGALALWALGYPDQAAESAREGIALAESLGHVPSVLHALWFAGTLYHLRRDAGATLDCAERLLALGREHGLMQYLAVGGILHGWAQTQSRIGEEGLAELRSSVGIYEATTTVMLDVYCTVLTKAELDAGNVAQAAAALVETERVGRGFWRAECLRLKGDLQRRGPVPDSATAEQFYLEAITVARAQQARSLELRAATGLVRLWRDEGRRDEARDLLAPLYGWFAEGLDTPDLVEAKTLLDSLV